jgi:hypothetical protein
MISCRQIFERERQDQVRFLRLVETSIEDNHARFRPTFSSRLRLELQFCSFVNRKCLLLSGQEPISGKRAGWLVKKKYTVVEEKW